MTALGSESGPGSPAQVLRTGSVHRDRGRVRTPQFDDAQVVAAVQRAYPLGRWRSWRRTELGASNVSWFVETDAGDVVLRRSHALKTAAGARFECALIDVLCAAGFPAPEVQRTRDGQVLVELDGTVHMVMRRLPGGTYDKESPAHLAAAARGLAWYHRIVSGIAGSPATSNGSFEVARLGPAGRATLAAAVEVVTPGLEPDVAAALRADTRYLADAMVRTEEELGDRQDQLTTGIAHGSYGQTALLLTGDELSGVLDFDRATHDLLGLDLAYAVDAFCRPGPARRKGVGLDLDLAGQFLHHYRTQAPVTDRDLRAVPAFLRAQRLGKLLKKCQNVLTVQATTQQHPVDVTKFARGLDRECSRVRWLTEHVLTLPEQR
jgi:Ser/Thr protein kinase RdoA (MazF antagonist)